MGRDAGVLTGVLTIGTGARGGGRGYAGSILPLLVGLPLPSPPATVAWVETSASSPAASPQVPVHGGQGGGLEGPSTPLRQAYGIGGGRGLRRVAFWREPALSFGKLKRPPNRWTPVASRAVFWFAWTVCGDSKLTDMAGSMIHSRVTRTSSLLRKTKSKLATYSAAGGVPLPMYIIAFSGEGGAGCPANDCSASYGLLPRCRLSNYHHLYQRSHSPPLTYDP